VPGSVRSADCAYLLLAVNLEAYRFAAGAWSLSVESLATAVVAFRTLLEWGIDPGPSPP